MSRTKRPSKLSADERGALVVRLANILAVTLALVLPAHAQSVLPNRFLVYKYPMVPPAEYIRPFEGAMTITRLPTMQAVREACPNASPINSGLIGCAVPWRAVPESELRCDVYIVSDDVLKAKGLTYKLIYNHELAHCNGWPWNHPDAQILYVTLPEKAFEPKMEAVQETPVPMTITTKPAR
jgi:hypothetical protein